MSTSHDTDQDPKARSARAFVYLRVSTKEQAEKGGTSEGYSIPAQREACLRKAEDLGAAVIDEFVDRGESARTAARPELQRLLSAIADARPDYVIVHKVDRLARSREDDVLINVELRRNGVQLVSCTESIDETPSGKLLHGIMSTIAEFYSRNLATEVQKGLLQKARAGGTPGKAPLGYRNVRAIAGGREVRTVDLDPERAPLLRWAFEAYSTGDWTLRRLLDELTARGFVRPETAKMPSKPISLAHLNRMMRNRYYIGEVRYQDVWYPGAHEPLISRELFDQVQLVLDSHDVSGEKARKHQHYLKGTVWCGQCGARLCVANNTGNGGTYPYFICLGRQRNRSSCKQRAVRIEAVVETVADHYRTIQLPEEDAAELRTRVMALIEEQKAVAAKDAERQQRRIQQLNDQRQKLLQAHYAEAIPLDLMRVEMGRIEKDRSEAESRLKAADLHFVDVEQALDSALALATDCHRAYLAAQPKLRRAMNQAFFVKVYISDDATVNDEETAEPFATLFDPAAWELLGVPANDSVSGPERRRRRPRTLGTASCAYGSQYELLVREGGLEPPRPFGHRNLNPARLPIPPLPQ